MYKHHYGFINMYFNKIRIQKFVRLRELNLNKRHLFYLSLNSNKGDLIYKNMLHYDEFKKCYFNDKLSDYSFLIEENLSIIVVYNFLKKNMFSLPCEVDSK